MVTTEKRSENNICNNVNVFVIVWFIWKIIASLKSLKRKFSAFSTQQLCAAYPYGSWKRVLIRIIAWLYKNNNSFSCNVNAANMATNIIVSLSGMLPINRHVNSVKRRNILLRRPLTARRLIINGHIAL